MTDSWNDRVLIVIILLVCQQVITVHLLLHVTHIAIHLGVLYPDLLVKLVLVAELVHLAIVSILLIQRTVSHTLLLDLVCVLHALCLPHLVLCRQVGHHLVFQHLVEVVLGSAPVVGDRGDPLVVPILVHHLLDHRILCFHYGILSTL